mmetsp:Transcript_10596/g.27793  ORF Transcript_10596/g.27793 Transcript_10596/m.27793 type:complete len:517 (-) Transcript_10596:187-1737(-)
MYKSFVKENAALKAYADCEKEISDAGDDMDRLTKLLDDMEKYRNQIEDLDGWNLDGRVDRVLLSLGFEPEQADNLVGSFSGGWKVRIGLGKVLLQNPDLLLLDEPTNHLDLESVEWLEGFLSNSDLPMVIVSHDREFMDRLCTKIVEVEGGDTFEYPGNYSTHLKLKAERRTAWESAWERQEKFIKEQRQYIARNKFSAARSSQVKSREKMLKRMTSSTDYVPQPPKKTKPLVFRFPPAPRSSRDVIELAGVTHGYGDRKLFEDVDLVLERGDRVAILGPNGSGKSTLLRIVMGTEKPMEGEALCRELPNVVANYFEQNQADVLNLEMTVMETLREAADSEYTYEDLRALLGKFLFKGDSVEKKVEALSGGEKARLALCKMMLTPANVLVLDEPTNHLDIPAKEMLEEAIQHYSGTVVVVSHDRYFVSQIANTILAIEDQSLEMYDGDYKHYMEQNGRVKEINDARVISGVTDIRPAPKIEVREEQEKQKKKKKNFGGSGVAAGKDKTMNKKRWNK